MPEPLQQVIDQLTACRINKKLTNKTIELLRDMATQLQPEMLVVSLKDRTVKRGGVTVKLSPNQASALYALSEKGGIVTVADLKKAVYGCVHKKRSTNVVRVIMTELRIRLYPLDVDISNHFGQGYRLDIKPAKRRAA